MQRTQPTTNRQTNTKGGDMRYEYEMAIALVILGVHIGIVIMAIADYYNTKDQPNPKQSVNDHVVPSGHLSIDDYKERVKKLYESRNPKGNEWDIKDYINSKPRHPNPQQEKINNTQHEMD